jgi:hypothetical protein
MARMLEFQVQAEIFINKFILKDAADKAALSFN